MNKSNQTTNILMLIGKAFTNRRLVSVPKKITQTQIAEKIGSSRSYLNKIEAGRQNLTIDKLCTIADQLDLEVQITLIPKQ